MRLKPGDHAPDFVVRDVSDAMVSLASLRGHHVLVAFHRFATCPFCNLRVHTLASRFAALAERGLRVVAFFESSTENLRAGAARQKVPFPLVADPELNTYALYGAGDTSVVAMLRTLPHVGEVRRAKALALPIDGPRDGSVTRLPADFLVAPDGRIAVAHYGNDYADHLPIPRIESALPTR